MNQDAKRKLENQLLVMGLKQLTDPDLIQQLADLVSNWPGDKNQFFVDLLNECDGSERRDMYDAMAPKLRFRPLSYVDCEMSISARASQEVSQRRARVEGQAPAAYEVGGISPFKRPTPKATLKCANCGIIEQFKGETPVDAITKARKKGWKKDLAQFDREYCPQCEIPKPRRFAGPVVLADA